MLLGRGLRLGIIEFLVFVRRFREACHAAAWRPFCRASVSVCTMASQPRESALTGDGLGREAGHAHGFCEHSGHLEEERHF